MSGRVTGKQIKDDSLTGDDIDESTLVISLDDVVRTGNTTTASLSLGNIDPNDSVYSVGSAEKVWSGGYFKDLNVTNQLVVSSTAANQELLRLKKGDADSRYLVFESDNVDKFEMYLNNFENFIFSTTDTTDDIVFRLNGHSAIYMDGYPKEVRIWDSYNSTYNTKINSSLDINGVTKAENFLPKTNLTYDLGTATEKWNNLHVNDGVVYGDLDVKGELYFSDALMAELSIPGVQLQTDTNAYTFTCPYDLEITGIQIILDSHGTSGNVTVTTSVVGGSTLNTTSITGTDLFATATFSSNRSAGDDIRLAITATPSTNTNGLRANLLFRRRA
jgi:hypothetical protein